MTSLTVTKGNVNSGATSFGIGAKISNSRGAFSWDAGISVDLIGSKKTLLKNRAFGATGQKLIDLNISSSSRSDTILFGGIDWALAEKLSLGFDLNMNSHGKEKDTFTSNGLNLNRTIIDWTTSEYSAQAKYAATENLIPYFKYSLTQESLKYGQPGTIITGSPADYETLYGYDTFNKLPSNNSKYTLGVKYLF